ncbi:MAG: sporulation stage II protein [Alteromonadaceae bacterium]|nr:sporulation stage II protein [Alteromonadaceae bacterium]
MSIALIAILVLIYISVRKDRRLALRREKELVAALESARRRLRSSLSDTRSMLNQEASVILVFDRQTLTLLFANQQALDLFGYNSAAELSDKVIMRPDAWQPHPFSLLDFERWMNQLKASGSQRKEWIFTGQDGQGIWTDCYLANTVFEGKTARILSANNINRYKMDRIADVIRNRVLTSINAGVSLESIFDSLCKLAEIRLKDSRCQIAVFDQQRNHLETMGASRFAKDLRSRLPIIAARYGETSIGTAAYTKNRVVCESIRDDHRWQGYTQIAEQLDVDAVWSEPVLDHKGQLLGVLSAFSSVPKKPDGEAIEEMTSVVSLMSLAIERQKWRSNLEAAASSERFIRQLGVELVNLATGETFKNQLRASLHRVVAHYELGSISVWEHDDTAKVFTQLVSTSKNPETVSETGPAVGSGNQSIEENFVLNASSKGTPDYITSQDPLHPHICVSSDPKPVLFIPLDNIEQQDLRIGFISVQSQFMFVAQETIEHLQVIGTMVRTVLLNRRLVQTLSQAMETEQIARKKLEGELSVARSIQMAMVPGAGQFKEKYRNWTIEAWLQPAKAVGGDLYEFIRLPSGKAIVAVGDVSDKGAPAALFMAKTVSLLNLLVRSHDGDLQTVANALNNELCRSNDSCMFVTMILCAIDLTTGNATWLNAGHNAPLEISSIAAPRFVELESGPPLGLYEDVSYPVKSARIEPGKKISMYSDGVTEAFNARGEEFGDDRLLSLGFRPHAGPDGLLGVMRQHLLDFIGGAPQSDDITLLTIHHHGQGS